LLIFLRFVLNLLSVSLATLLLLGATTHVEAKIFERKKKKAQTEVKAAPAKQNINGLKPYAQVITPKAKSSFGFLTVHKVDNNYFFEIPDSMLNRDILIVNRISKAPTSRQKSRVGYPGDILGSKVIRFENKDNGAETAIEAIEGMSDKLSGLDCKIVDGDPKLKKTIKETVQFETMSAGQVEELANELKKGLEEIIAYRSSKQFLKNEASVRRLKDSVEKMSSRSTNAPDDDNTKHSRAVNKATVAMARAAMRLLGIPTRGITFYDTYTNFCITLARKCIATYETR
jgi:hypothetical protein